MHHGEKRSMREASDAVSRTHSVSAIANGPSSGQLNILGVKVTKFKKSALAILITFLHHGLN